MQASLVTRRRSLAILAGTAAAALTGGRTAAAPADYEWQGIAMGAEARIVFSGVEPASARAMAVETAAEIERLERSLSLFRSDSEIVRLNRDKALEDASGDLSRALDLGLRVAAATGGLFDPTVQALWEASVDWYAQSPTAGLPPDAVVARAGAAVDWRKVHVQAGSIALGEDQRLTLNGLGQGYVTDRIADLLRQRGFQHVLVDLGEQRALGRRGDGAPWRVARPGAPDIALADAALATSEGSGCVLGAGGAAHHLFDPRTGRSAGRWRRVTVSHRSAAVADALSTAFYAADGTELAEALTRIAGVRVWTTDRDGREKYWTSRADG